MPAPMVLPEAASWPRQLAKQWLVISKQPVCSVGFLDVASQIGLI
jgi:hypothetical protein